MLKCNLSKLLGERRIKISDLARDTGIHRNTISRIYNETVTRIELDVVEYICAYLDITVGELYEMPPIISTDSEDISPYELLNAIESAQERLIVLSPYISTKVVTTEFIDKLQSCLNRGGLVYLIYGSISDTIEGSLEAHKQLELLAERKSNLKIIVTNHHAKMIIVDSKYVLRASYSFLAQLISPNNFEGRAIHYGHDFVDTCISDISDMMNISLS